MNIQEPKVDLWLVDSEYEHIARCARICYASDKDTGNVAMVERLWKNNHKSMFRHMPVYYIIPKKLDVDSAAMSFISKYMHDGKWYVSTNRQCAIEYMGKYKEYEIPYCMAHIDPIFTEQKLLRYTFVIDTGIDITREYNRKSPNAIAERSTRYVDFIKKLGVVFKQCHWMYGLSIYKYCLVRMMCRIDEWFYKISRSKYGLNLPPQDARWCLFLDVMSRVAYTYTVKEWEWIINLRLYDWTGAAHPDAKVVARKIKKELELLGYDIKNYKQDESKSSAI